MKKHNNIFYGYKSPSFRFKLYSVLFLLTATVSVVSLDKGDEAANFANIDLSGNFEFSKNYIGKDWVIMDFFATYCIPCKEEIPELEALYSEFSEKGLRCFVFATDKNGKNVVDPYFKAVPTTLKVLLDNYMVTAKRFNVESIPTVFLINPEGKIAFKAVGYKKESIEKMHAILSEALK